MRIFTFYFPVAWTFILGLVFLAICLGGTWALIHFRRFLNVIRVVLLLVFLLAVGSGANFLICVGLGLSIGGEATLGKVENGKYYVGEHGRYTQVSKETYWRMYRYEKVTFTISDIMFWPYFVAGIIWLTNAEKIWPGISTMMGGSRKRP